MKRGGAGRDARTTPRTEPPVEPWSAFVKASLRVGVEATCVVEEKWRGYQETPLEKCLWSAAQDVETWLRRSSRRLTAPVLTQLMEAVLRCAPAVDCYSARLLSACGDWDIAFSPACGAVWTVLRSVRSALERLARRGIYPADQVPGAIWKAPMKLSYDGGEVTWPLHRFVFPEGMATPGRDAYGQAGSSS